MASSVGQDRRTVHSAHRLKSGTGVGGRAHHQIVQISASATHFAEQAVGADRARGRSKARAADLGRDFLGELPSIERFFGNTWFADGDLYARVHAKWTAFRTEYETFVLSAMTVN